MKLQIDSEVLDEAVACLEYHGAEYEIILKKLRAIMQLKATSKDSYIEAIVKRRKELQEQAAAYILQGICPDCDGEGEQGGQFCGGYWTCESCNGTGKYVS